MKTFSNVPIVTLLFALSTLVGGCGGGSGGGDGGGGTTPTLNIADAQINEGDSGTTTLSFSVSLDKAATDVINVDYATANASATQGSDYTAASGTLSIPAGNTQASISVSINGDTDVESDETLSLTLSNLSANASAGDMNATGTILDDDSSSLPQLSVSGGSIIEGDSGTVNLVFTASLSAASATDVSFNYDTADGSASSADDYQAVINGSGTISVGQTQVILNVMVNGDTDVEANETLSLTLSNLSANVSAGTLSASGTILDDDGSGTASTSPLNDTGVDSCSNALANGLACNDSVDGTDQYPGQDAEHGRDLTSFDNRDGRAGFSFTKLDAAGNPLADQSADYATTPWACVRDEVTGLVWEVKTDDGSLQDKEWRYLWYDLDGDHGYTPGTPDDGSDTVCLTPGSCDTAQYRSAVIGIGLCGFSDWRLPTRRELLSLVDYGIDAAPAIDTKYFPNTGAFWPYWTNTTGRDGHRYVVGFSNGASTREMSLAYRSIRLVRGGE